MIDEGAYSELDRYFHSAMNEAERSAFESKMNADKQLREEFDWLNNMLGGMKSQGRSVMKQTIASAIAGIPSGEVAKYKPSVNGKSFLKKYWVAVTVSVAVAATAIAVYKYVTRHVDPAHEGSDTPTESTLMDDSLTMDSCLEEMHLPGGSDSAKDSSDAKGGAAPVDENADVLYEGRARPVYLQDSAQNGDYIFMSEVLPAKGHRIEDMKTQINKKYQPPYTYELNGNLILNANYTSTAGFVFTGSGDTVYMTDNNEQKYLLVRGKGVQPLTPMRVGASK